MGTCFAHHQQQTVEHVWGLIIKASVLLKHWELKTRLFQTSLDKSMNGLFMQI